MNSSTQNKRKERDLMKLMMSNYEVTLADENNPNDLHVIFSGPKDSPYEDVRLFLNLREFGKFMCCCQINTLTNHLRLVFITKCIILMLMKSQEVSVWM